MVLAHWPFKKGDYVKAIADYTEAIRLDPKLALAYYSRGLTSVKKADYDKAITDFTEVIRLDPKYSIAYYARGSCYTKKREYDKAIADFTEAILLNPKDSNAYGKPLEKRLGRSPSSGRGSSNG